MPKNPLLNLNEERLQKIEKHAEIVAAVFNDNNYRETMRDKGLNLRISSSYISLVSVNKGTGQQKFHMQEDPEKKALNSRSRQGILKLIDDDIEAHFPGKNVPEKELQSFIIYNSLFNNVDEANKRRMIDIEECVRQKTGDTQTKVYFITDEVALMLPENFCEYDKNKVVCDVLALRVTAEGKYVPMLVELKTDRLETKLLAQLRTYGKAFKELSVKFEKIYSKLMGEEIIFSQNIPEQWMIWNYKEKDLPQNGNTYLIGYDEDGMGGYIFR